MSATDRPITSPLLVGRAREAERLETSLQLARQGAGQAVLLVGEAGVGKSRLVAETRLQAAAARWTCLVGYCFEGDRGFAYAPLVDALRAFFAAQPATVVAESLGPFAAEVVKLLPELSLAIPEVRPTPAIDPEAEKRRLHEALLHFFLRLAQKSPLLIILEDLHWCDETSLEFFHLLARRSRTMPILLLATYRREEFSASLAHLLAQLDRERLAQEIVLQPLAPAEVDAMVRAIFELQRPVRSAFLDTLCTLTEGNPFFVEEVLKTLVVTGDIFYAEGQWDRKPLDELRIPRSVQDAVQRRTSRLSPAAHRVLSVAAVAGRRFDFSLLQALTGDDEVALLTHIKELMTAQLVVEATAEQFAFRHALTRQAIYAGLLVRERKALHRAIAETMVRMAAPSPDHSASAGQVTHLTALAYHFFAGEVWDQALVFAQAAGQQAQALYAPLAAVEHLTRALEAVDQLAATTPVQNSAAVGARLYRTRGLAYETLGDFEAARADLVAALRLAQQADDRLGQWQALLDLGELWASRDYRQTGDYFRLALQLARTLEDASILARSLNRMGNWCINTEREHEGLHHHQAALEIFQRLNDPPGLAATHDLMGAACLITGNHVHAAMHLEQSAALFRQLQDRRGLASTLAVRAISNETYTIEHIVSPPVSVAASIREAEEALQIAREIGWRAGENYALLVLARVIVVTGGYKRSLALAQQAQAIAQEIEHRQWQCQAQMSLGYVYVELLAFTAAQRHFEQAVRLGQESGSGFLWRVTNLSLALSQLLQQDLAAAARTLSVVFETDAAPNTLAHQVAWRVRAELALAQGDATLALDLVDQLLAGLPNIEQVGERGVPGLALLRGKALMLLAQPIEAEAALQNACEGAEAKGVQSLRWRTQAALGGFYRAQGRQEDAAHAFAAARTIIAELAAQIPDELLEPKAGLSLRENFLRQASAHLPAPPRLTPRQAAKHALDGLTGREVDVAVQIAQGKSNREVAAALVVSERTVETHIANILGKLGFSSRRQIAAWVIDKGLSDRLG